MADSFPKEEDDNFFNALDDFPFYDCLDCTAESDSESHYSTWHFGPPLSPSSDSKFVGFVPKSSSNTASFPGPRRRRFFAKHSSREVSSDSSEDLISGSSAVSEITGGVDGNTNKVNCLDFTKNQEKDIAQLDSGGTESGLSGVVDSLSKEKFGDFMFTSSNGDDSGGAESSTARDSDEDHLGFLFVLVEQVTRAIVFQLSLIIGFVTFPFWVLYASYKFLLDPFLTIRRGRDYLLRKIIKICNLLLDAVPPSVSAWFKENHSFFKVVVRCAWGLCWAAYVGSILVGLLVSAFVVGGLIMRCLVEEPFHQKHSLNFDFTKNKPVAVVPILAGRSGSVDYGESILMEYNGVARVLSPNRKLQATVRLTLPESEYNRNLGMFQVRIEFVCANGKTLASLRQPCMLYYRSDPIRLLQVFIKVVPLVAGYLSESQTLKLKFQGFTEGDVPSAYLKVTIEQRAEFLPAGGIPEVYNAALLLESELPLFKSILWSWRKTLFVWLSMILFMIELLFALVCCRTVVMHNLRLQNNNAAAAGNTTIRTDQQNAM